MISDAEKDKIWHELSKLTVIHTITTIFIYEFNKL